MARVSRLLRKYKQKGVPTTTPTATATATDTAEAAGGHAVPRDPQNNPNPPPTPDNPTNHPRPGPVPPGQGGDPTTPGGPYDAQPGVPMNNAVTVNTGTELPKEYGPFLAALAQQAKGDTAGQQIGLAEHMSDYLQAQPFRDYLTQYYGDIMGVNFNLPDPSMSSLLDAIFQDTQLGSLGATLGQGGTVADAFPNGAPPPGQGTGGIWDKIGRMPNPGKRGDFYASSVPQNPDGGGGGGTGGGGGGGYAAVNARDKQRNAGARYGYSYASQGLDKSPDHGMPFLNRQEEKAKHGPFAPLTWDTQYDASGRLVGIRPLKNQEGRINALKAKGLDPTKFLDPSQVLPANQLDAINRTTIGGKGQARTTWLNAHPELANQPGGGMDAWLAWKGLRAQKGAGQIWRDPATGNWVNAGGEMWSPEGWKIEDGKLQGGPGYQYPGGTGGGTGTGGGGGGAYGSLESSALSQYLKNIEGGGWNQQAAAFNPDNPNSWALIAPQAAGIAADKDRALRDIRAQVGRGGESQAAQADAINNAYSNIAGLRQGQISQALEFMRGRAFPSLNSLTPMGSAASGAQTLGQKYSTDKEYNLGLEKLKVEKSGQNKNFWADIFKSIGSIIPG